MGDDGAEKGREGRLRGSGRLKGAGAGWAAMVAADGVGKTKLDMGTSLR